MKKYPRIGSVEKYSHPKPRRCKLCSNKATRRVDVQFSYMRGDDSVYYICDDHDPKALLP